MCHGACEIDEAPGVRAVSYAFRRPYRTPERLERSIDRHRPIASIEGAGYEESGGDRSHSNNSVNFEGAIGVAPLPCILHSNAPETDRVRHFSDAQYRCEI